MRLVAPGSLSIEPFLGSGVTPGGIQVEYHESYPPVLGRVLAVHPTVTECSPGDVVVFRPYAYDEEDYTRGTIKVLYEKDVRAVIEGYPDVE